MRVLKITINSVSERRLVLRAVRRCPECNGSLVPAAFAAHRSAQSLRAICRRVEAEEVHYTDGIEGLLICMESLTNRNEAAEKLSLDMGVLGE